MIFSSIISLNLFAFMVLTMPVELHYSAGVIAILLVATCVQSDL